RTFSVESIQIPNRSLVTQFGYLSQIPQADTIHFTMRKLKEELVDAIQNRIRQEAIPLCFDKPVHFINFSSFDRQSPTYINLVRDPVDNFIAR
ncbi:hypothetical protein Trydic_g13560, partial [Trypoxylus dichotomus]